MFTFTVVTIPFRTLPYQGKDTAQCTRKRCRNI